MSLICQSTKTGFMLPTGHYFWMVRSPSRKSSAATACLSNMLLTHRQPVTWLLLSELLEAEDILTLQEYLGYCLLPTNRGQTMMLLKGNGGEGKSRIGVVMQKMLGSNMKNGSIAKVERSPFARADLEHQLLRVDDD